MAAPCFLWYMLSVVPCFVVYVTLNKVLYISCKAYSIEMSYLCTRKSNLKQNKKNE